MPTGWRRITQHTHTNSHNIDQKFYDFEIWHTKSTEMNMHLLLAHTLISTIQPVHEHGTNLEWRINKLRIAFRLRFLVSRNNLHSKIHEMSNDNFAFSR